ncbi:nucleotidyltransferase domain-containing protein [Candidatus Micrarchaeota archaeon]|nr:nucleotidyltransferase domain-containing protein [Candidatus Micrarchaeota archaeon]
MIEKYAVIRAMHAILARPNKKFSIVALAKEAKMAPSAASYALEYMLEEGMVGLEVIGRTHQYKTDLSSFLARQWKVLFSLDEIKKSGFAESVLKKVKNVTSIILYGSVATGRDDEKSDIDIIVIADAKKTAAVFEKAGIGARELNVQIYTPAEWRRKAGVDKAFYDNAIIDSIVLYGEKPVVL